jgi:hypothetical protein
MDFGDILDEWEGRRAKSPAKGGGPGNLKGLKKGPSRSCGEGEGASPSLKRTDPLTAWLRINGVRDKDAEAEGEAIPPAERRRRLLDKRPDAVIDLHGQTRDEAWESLESFFRAGRQRGLEKVLIVHGKGNHSGSEAVLKRMVRDFVERCPFAGESGSGGAAYGGGGSTWVLLKLRTNVPGK